MFSWEASGEMAIHTERLLLRPPRRADLVPVDTAIRETLDELVLWLPWARPGHRRSETRQYLRHARSARAHRSAFEFVLSRVGSADVYGMASLHRIDWLRRSAGLGYWVRRDAWGQGLATEAAGALVQEAFRSLELHRVEAHVATGNKSSQRVVEKLGFQREGIARGVEFVNGCYLDHIQYSLLRTDRQEPPG